MFEYASAKEGDILKWELCYHDRAAVKAELAEGIADYSNIGMIMQLHSSIPSWHEQMKQLYAITAGEIDSNTLIMSCPLPPTQRH